MLDGFRRTGIVGTGAALPRQAVSSAEIDRRIGKPEGWTERMSGVQTRYFCESEDQIDLAVEAARKALNDAGLSGEMLDVVIFAAAVPYQPIPNTAPLVMRRLGIPEGKCSTFDVNATCLSFLTALDLLSSMIACGRYRRGLIVSAEVASRGLPWESDPRTAALFGDGAAAAVVSVGNEPGGIAAARMETYPSSYEACSLGAGGTRFDFHRDFEAFSGNALVQMDGKALYRHTLEHFDGFLHRLLADASWAMDDVEIVIPHQASPGALRHLAEQSGFGPERVVNLVARQGNQIAASLPSALDAARRAGRLSPGTKALMIGTAAGLSLGGLAMIM